MKALSRESISVLRVGVHKVITKFEETGRWPGSGGPAKVTETVKNTVEGRISRY